MPFTLPTAATAGSVLTATNYNQAVRSNAMFGMATFTNEAARDAALTSPEEGMMAYLTAPTVPAATGTTTAVPTGIITVYNGSSWVCITPVATSSTTSATTTSTSFVTTLTGDTTAQSVTLTTGTTALVTLSATKNINAVAQAITAVSVSGATTRAAVSAEGIYNGANTVNLGVSRTFVLTGLTAGTNTFTLNYGAFSAGTVSYVNRSLIVQGIA